MTDRSADSASSSTPVGAGASGPWFLAALLMAVQAVGLVAFGLWSGIDGGSARSWSFAVTLVVLAGCVAALAWLLRARRSIARTPTMLWNALLVPAGFTVGDGGAPWAGWLIVGIAVVTFLVVLLCRSARQPEAD